MMETRACACGQTTVRDDAARWFVRLQEPAVSADEQQRFDAWLNQHSQHRDEFQLLQGLWSAADLLPSPRLKPLLKPRRTVVNAVRCCVMRWPPVCWLLRSGWDCSVV